MIKKIIIIVIMFNVVVVAFADDKIDFRIKSNLTDENVFDCQVINEPEIEKQNELRGEVIKLYKIVKKKRDSSQSRDIYSIPVIKRYPPYNADAKWRKLSSIIVYEFSNDIYGIAYEYGWKVFLHEFNLSSRQEKEKSAIATFPIPLAKDKKYYSKVEKCFWGSIKVPESESWNIGIRPVSQLDLSYKEVEGQFYWVVTFAKGEGDKKTWYKAKRKIGLPFEKWWQGTEAIKILSPTITPKKDQ